MAKNSKPSSTQKEPDCGKGNNGSTHRSRRGRGQRNRGNSGYSSKSQETKDEQPAKNDIGWYSRYPAIYDAASNFIWSRPAGVKIPRGYQHVTTGGLNNASVNVATPGVMAIEVVHGVGDTHDTGTNAPVNVAGKAIYTWTRHMNSGHSNYDNPDLMIYLMAMAEVYAAISFIGRAFGTVAMFSGSNRFLPEALLNLQNIDGDSLRDNYANFRARINILIQKAASLVVPLGMDIFNRYVWLYQNYYSEGDIVKDQMYFLKPRGFRKFDHASDGSGMLKWFDLSTYYSGGKLTWGSFCLMLEDMLAPLIADEDINIMAGDLLKAYGENGIQRLTFLPEMFIATPQHVEEVLWQFKNAKAVSGSNFTGLDITQDNNHEYLIYEPATTAAATDVIANTAETMLVTNKTPDREINMINSRLAATVDYGVTGATPNAGNIICGSEFVSRVDVCYQSSGNIQRFQLARIYNYTSPTTAHICLWTPFQYAPEVLFYDTNDLYLVSMFEIDDYTLLTKEELRQVHDAAILSLFATPHVSI